MEDKELRVKDIPGGYPLCFNGDCAEKEKCLHYQAMLLTDGERQKGMAIYPAAWQDGECSCYREKRQVQKAWGFDLLYKNVDRHHKAEARQAVSSFFGRGNGQYYRAKNGEIQLTPKQQEGIMKIIAQFGPTDGIKFDHYITTWDFD